MCTSLVLETLDGKHLLSRTMDFAFILEANPTISPRNYVWQSSTDGAEYTNEYAFVGAGRELDKYIFADGLNEQGLSCASLYLPGEAVYAPEAIDGKINLAPQEFLLWMLGTCATIEDVAAKLADINLVDQPVALLGITTPLHWIFTDKSGRCAVIEPTEMTLRIKENPVGVMTNTPRLEWHIENLRNYTGLQAKQLAPVKFGDYVAKPFSQGTGTSKLPGGFTPTERFVRAAYLKENVVPAKNEEEAITNVWYILNSVRIPNGAVIKDNGDPDFTQYVASMCSESKTYYFTSYENNQINSVTLTDEVLENTKEPTTYVVDTVQNINQLI
ncbi:choloylglycine hydrolase family protein [Listeria booriae]|uniref:Choloylglycine hydrolase family protein n=1 Tax=Listeria booriae TaxID=1552123 RepID=A0A7X0Z5R0_9LIST|nr:choloylglycine hydrolase family protein [Listeria booriae]MBC1210332.1 choloylglycine hydrolase family protein [Listeria booriae]MBC2176427.1 choloylglycine hydrolase family protein [Listeria booriae]MBC2367454.1 choloylglycine hydrolase family protein [Listeria booriae]